MVGGAEEKGVAMTETTSQVAAAPEPIPQTKTDILPVLLVPGLALLALEVASDHDVEKLVGASELDVGFDHDRVPALHDRILDGRGTCGLRPYVRRSSAGYTLYLRGAEVAPN